MAVFIFAGCCLVGLFLVTVYLYYINWNPSLLAQGASAVALGVLASMLSLLMTLKDETVDKSFTSTVLVNPKDYLPPLISLPESPLSLQRRYMSYSSIARTPIPVVGEKVPKLIAVNNLDDAMTLYPEIVRYYLFRELMSYTRQTKTVAQVSTTRGTGFIPSIHIPPTTDDMTRCVGFEYVTNPKDCRMLTDGEKMMWELSGPNLPEGTKITFEQTRAPDKYIIKLEKPMFFSATIAFECMGGGGNGSVLLKTGLSPTDAKQYQTYAIQVTCSAYFSRWTSQNKLANQHKEWVKYLFSRVETEFKDEE